MTLLLLKKNCEFILAPSDNSDDLLYSNGVVKNSDSIINILFRSLFSVPFHFPEPLYSTNHIPEIYCMSVSRVQFSFSDCIKIDKYWKKWHSKTIVTWAMLVTWCYGLWHAV